MSKQWIRVETAKGKLVNRLAYIEDKITSCGGRYSIAFHPSYKDALRVIDRDYDGPIYGKAKK